MNARKIIREAAFRLFELQPFEQITVQQILEEAEVARRTFYEYFRDKYDLLEKYWADVLGQAVDASGASRLDARRYLLLVQASPVFHRCAGHHKSLAALWEAISRTLYAYLCERMVASGGAPLSPADDLAARAAAALCVVQSFVHAENHPLDDFPGAPNPFGNLRMHIFIQYSVESVSLWMFHFSLVLKEMQFIFAPPQSSAQAARLRRTARR